MSPHVQRLVEEYREQMELATMALLAGEREVGLAHMQKCIQIFINLELLSGLTIEDFEEDINEEEN